jgi:hypothetical protein
MRLSIPGRLMMIIAVSLALIGAPKAFAQQEDPEEPIQAMPKVKTAPSVQATPIEIPGKGQPVIKKKPSVQATPIEIPGKGQPVIKKKPSVQATPIEIPDKR